MAITGIDTIDGKQIIAAGAVSAKSAEMAYNDENGNPITGYLTAVPEGYATTGDLTAYQTTAGMTAYQEAGDYYSASNPSGFITGVDLTPYQTIEGMTAYQPAGSYLTTADSANFYTTANESGFISEVPAGTMNESAFSYDASDNITGYNGSAFKAGDEFPQSATEAIETVTSNSADWNGTTYTVSSNSGAWGGSALPISAGPGIKFEMVNNTLVATNDETVLWSGNAASEVTLSESFENFESIKLVHNSQVEEFWKPKAGDAVRYWHTYGTMAQGAYKMAMVHLSLEDATHIANVSAKSLNYSLTGTETAPISVTVNDVYALNTIIEVIGINRIAGGN